MGKGNNMEIGEIMNDKGNNKWTEHRKVERNGGKKNDKTFTSLLGKKEGTVEVEVAKCGAEGVTRWMNFAKLWVDRGRRWGKKWMKK